MPAPAPLSEPSFAVPPDMPAADLPGVLIVDDSAVARAVMEQVIGRSGRFRVAGSLTGADAALAFLRTRRADLILLDIAMPGTDGLSALPDLIAAGAGARIVIVSSSADEGTAAQIQALALGAADTLVKPSGANGGTSRFAETLIAKLERLVSRAPVADSRPVPAALSPAPTAAPVPGEPFDLVAIGASTGGIHALGQLLRALPAGFTAPILVTQHLPPSFIPYFAAQLALLGQRPAEVATDRLRIRPGRIVVAPGDAHLRLVALPDGGGAVRLSREPAASGCMPSVDPMLEAVAEVYGKRALGIVLSGMGRDGAAGARALRASGGGLVAQDQASSVVWGMPGAVASIADAVLPPARIGTLLATGRRP